MKSIRVAIEHAADTIHPMHAMVCRSSFVEREVLLEWTATPDLRTLVFYVAGDREAYEKRLANRAAVEAYEIAGADEEGFLLYVRERNRGTEAELFAAFDRETVVVVPPVEFRSDRTMHLSLVGPPDDLQGILADLPDGTTVDVLEIGEYDRALDRTLTDRQREAVAAAWEVGYYEIPREGGIESVAAELDCAVSTASDLLRRAERRLVAGTLDGPY